MSRIMTLAAASLALLSTMTLRLSAQDFAAVAPDYANPSAFHEQSVTIGTDPWRLPGTLTEPNGAGPFPAIVLVQGSGPRDEDDSPTLKPGETVSMMGVPTPASYILDLRSYVPAATVARLKIPILVLQGLSDYQVTRADLEGWEKALAGHNNVTTKTYPGLCHLFTPGSDPPSPADYDKPAHVSKSTLDDIASWVAAR